VSSAAIVSSVATVSAVVLSDCDAALVAEIRVELVPVLLMLSVVEQLLALVRRGQLGEVEVVLCQQLLEVSPSAASSLSTVSRCLAGALASHVAQRVDRPAELHLDRRRVGGIDVVQRVVVILGDLRELAELVARRRRRRLLVAATARGEGDRENETDSSASRFKVGSFLLFAADALDDVAGDVGGHFHVLRELHRVRGAPWVRDRRSVEYPNISDNGTWALMTWVLPAAFHALDTATAAGKVAHDVAHVVLGRARPRCP
jgi:hypothetical protein